MRGTNDDELVPLIEYGKRVRRRGALHRVHGRRRRDAVVVRSGASRATPCCETLRAHYGEVTPQREASSAPADRFVLPDGTVFGIISSTTAPFCHACDRSRLTADGMWYLCLYARLGTDLRRALRSGAPTDEIKALIVPKWQQRRDRGAEDRLAARARGSLFPVNQLRRDPHLEMHTRGG